MFNETKKERAERVKMMERYDFIIKELSELGHKDIAFKVRVECDTRCRIWK